MEHKNSLQELMNETLAGLKTAMAANTIIGQPIQTDEVTLIPVSRLSIKVGQALWLGLYFGAKALRQIILLRGEQNKKTEKNKTERRSEPDGT